MLWLLRAIYGWDRELDDQTEICIMIMSDSWRTLTIPDLDTALITRTGLILSTRACVCLHVWACVYKVVCALATHRPHYITCNEITGSIFMSEQRQAESSATHKWLFSWPWSALSPCFFSGVFCSQHARHKDGRKQTDGRFIQMSKQDSPAMYVCLRQLYHVRRRGTMWWVVWIGTCSKQSRVWKKKGKSAE